MILSRGDYNIDSLYMTLTANTGSIVTILGIPHRNGRMSRFCNLITTL